MRKVELVVALLICFIMVMEFNLPQTTAAPNDTWRQVDPADVQIGKSYLIVSEHGALTNAQATINTPGDVTGDTQIGMVSKPVTIEDGLITSEVTEDMIWQFGLGANTAEASGGLGEGPGYYILNNAPGEGGGTEPLRRESSFNAQHAPLNTTSAANNANQQSLLLHALDEEEGTASLYIWSGNNQWNFALTSTVDGFTAKSKVAGTTSTEQLLEQMQESPSLRLYEPNVTSGVQHYIMASSGENGSISPTSQTGHVWVNDGEDVTFTFNPEFGFEVDKVTVNDEEVDVTDNTYTIQNVTASDTSIHVTFKPDSSAMDLPFTVYNDIFSVGNVTTAVIIDLGEGNTANLSDLSSDMFSAAARNTRLDGSTVIFDGMRSINRVYVNNDPEPLGYISPAPGSDDLVTDTPESGRYIIVELEFWNANGYTSGSMVSGNLQNAFSAILNYRINVDREIKLTDGTTIIPKFTQEAVVNPALDKFDPDKTNPGGTGNMDILISIDESWEDLGPLPLFIYNHGGGRGGPSGDYFAPMQTANGAAVLSKRQLENPGKYNAHIIATQNHSNDQDNNEALMAYVEKLAEEGKVDPNRIYMSGFSMGSMYTAGFYNRNPEFLAAIVPLAGGNLPTEEQINENPEYTKTSIWAHTHKDDFMGDPWTEYFSTGAGASDLYSEANVTVLETNQAFNFPYYGFDWTPHETEAQVFSNLIGQSNATFTYGAGHEEYADKNIFDWMFAQDRDPELETEELESALDKAKAITNEEAYTEESYAALQSAIANAEAVLADDEATQEDVNAEAEALQEAIDNLVEREAEELVLEIELDNEAIEVVGGKTYTITGTNAKITLPEDLPIGTKLKVTAKDPKDTNHEGLEVAGEILTFEFEYPNGQSPEGSFTLVLGYYDDVDTSKIAIYYYNDETDEWEHRGGKVDEENQVIELSVPHFSTYGVFAEVSQDENEQEEEESEETNAAGNNELPDTATNITNYLILGILLLVVGGAIVLGVRRKRV
ncbi:LPXTG cell wall anchor domain-containing protein [Gracilibacillus kekensis]|uniref:LPXTG-motif cell wall anchor domain-containing protein n=1 Tax=Gracilibacillus kekensis TaxID=1027249 RepID=A0A1M7Q1S4_9BACI|nr:LPXTG cell wall anchor domain-containing protein [Gracilibacillus kekensis]SHN23959.1 LPXTG-motif cell wall anchor domain-containing protein [Gracilibacillus kekensis]